MACGRVALDSLRVTLGLPGETISIWCIKFGVRYARRLRRGHRGYGDTLHTDEVFVKINGKQQYLWRAVNQDGDVVDVNLQARRDGAAHRELMPDVIHATNRYANTQDKCVQRLESGCGLRMSRQTPYTQRS